MKKIITFVLCVCMAFGVFSLTACNKNKGEKLQADAKITLNGKVEEEAYKAIPTHATGIKGRLKADFAADKNGLYVGISVSDLDMRYTGNSVAGILESDYVGIAIDTSAGRNEITPISEKTVLFRFDVKGRYAYSKGDDYEGWDEVAVGEGSEQNDSDMPKFAFRIDGTALPVGDTSEVEGNVGYYAELFFTWAQLGTSEKEINANGTIMYCLEHRDVGWDIVVDTNSLSSVHKYNTLTLLGDRKGANMPANASEITVDGKMDEAAWENVPVISSGVLSEKVDGGATAGEYTVKAFMGKNGMCIGIDVKETKLIASQRNIGQAYLDCGAEFRIHVFDKNDDPVVSHKWLFDLFGPKWHELTSGLDSKYAPYAEWQFDIRGTIYDGTNPDANADTDEGWGLELYIPFETLLLPYMNLGVANSDCYVMLLPAVASSGQKIVIPDGCDWDKTSTYVKIAAN